MIRAIPLIVTVSLVTALGGCGPSTLPPPTPQVPTTAAAELQIWVEWPIIPLGETQTMYARMLTADGTGVPDVEMAVAMQASHAGKTSLMPPTDDHGRTKLTFPVTNGKPGEFVQYEVTARVGGRTIVAHDRFLVWYGGRGRP